MRRNVSEDSNQTFRPSQNVAVDWDWDENEKRSTTGWRVPQVKVELPKLSKDKLQFKQKQTWRRLDSPNSLEKNSILKWFQARANYIQMNQQLPRIDFLKFPNDGFVQTGRRMFSKLAFWLSSSIAVFYRDKEFWFSLGTTLVQHLVVTIFLFLAVAHV